MGLSIDVGLDQTVAVTAISHATSGDLFQANDGNQYNGTAGSTIDYSTLRTNFEAIGAVPDPNPETGIREGSTTFTLYDDVILQALHVDLGTSTAEAFYQHGAPGFIQESFNENGEVIDRFAVHGPYVDTLVNIDNVIGSSIADSIRGNSSVNNLSGGGGNDQIRGFQGNDILDGGAGDDLILGGSNDDLINGGDDNDTVDGGPGTDTIFGDAGNDSLLGGSRRDVIFGGTGNDTLLGGRGDDILDGATDKFFGIGSTLVNPGSGEVDILGQIDFENPTAAQLEQYRASADDYIIGNRSQVYYRGSGNEDYAQITEFDSNDQIFLARGVDYQVRLQSATELEISSVVGGVADLAAKVTLVGTFDLPETFDTVGETTTINLAQGDSSGFFATI